MTPRRGAGSPAPRSERDLLNELLRLNRQRGRVYVYALKCEDDCYYVGATEHLPHRILQHTSGQGAKWTEAHPPVAVVHVEACPDWATARQRERDLTLAAARHYGASRVRGASWTGTDGTYPLNNACLEAVS